MNVFLMLLVLFVNILIKVSNAHFSPSVAFYDNLPAMYKTDRGWVVSDAVKDKLINYTEIIGFCKEVYPHYNITNAVPIFKKEVISNWCQINQKCTANDKYEIHPIQCFNSSFTYRPISIPSFCKFNMVQGKGCLQFHTWKKEAKSNCDENDQELRDLQVIFPCRSDDMTFSEMEYVCCADHDENNKYSVSLMSKLKGSVKIYRPIFHVYLRNKNIHKENRLFSKTKHMLIDHYNSDLGFLAKELKENLTKIMKTNDVLTSQQYKDDENKIYQIYKSNYESLNNEFKRELFHLDNIHISRIIRKSDRICRNKNNTESSISACLKELKNISNRIMMHHRRILKLGSFDQNEYKSFIESRLKHMYSRYLPLLHGHKNWILRFHEQLQKYRRKLKLGVVSERKWQGNPIRKKFQIYKGETILYLHYQEHYLSLAPMIGIIAVFCLVFIVAVSTLIYKYCNNPFRRITHNYVMRVVGESEQSSNSIDKPEIKLNLYENPIVNSTSFSKSVEKESLIENMEN